jgi:hypothetical protein
MYVPIWIIIIILILIANLYFKDWRNKKKRQFAPVSITVSPLWRSLLIDYGVINDEGWESLQKKCEAIDQPAHSVLLNGINFTVLKSDDDSELIYSEDTNKFYSEVDFSAHIKEIEFDSEVPALHPRFYVRTYIEGYELGVTTKESIEKGMIPADSRVPVTTLPYCIFRLPRYKYGILKQDEEEKMLEKHGWKREQRDEFDIVTHQPYIISHKYFKVYYEWI